ncbi:MAG: FimD/PapC N-terminal domain-containing protein, partial [Luteibacter sp.]
MAISPRSFRAAPGIAAIGLVVAYSIVALPLHAQQRANVEFDAAFLPGDTAMTIDLSRFSRGNPVMPGVYDADIRLNGEWQDRRSVRFLVAPGRDTDDAFPCIPAQDLAAFGVDVETGSPDLGACMPVGERIPNATVRFDVGEQRLDIDVPQSMLVRRHRAGAPVDQWDHGRASAQLGWRADVHRASGTHHRASRYVAADAGANVGAWRLREAGAWSGARYRRRHLYMERPMPFAHAHLRLGEFVLADDIFASRRFVGLSVSTDRRMFDDAGSGDAPV